MKASRNIVRSLPLITMLGVAIFCYKLWLFANTQLSVADEGSYLFKGYMFVRGDYYPFQEYAFWTNKAPLSFIIPGYIQYWFGPGLREGRYFAVLISILMIVGIWIVSNRLAGRGWATLAVWVVALSDWQTAVLSQALSQGLVACMLTWVFVLVLGEDRRMWQLILGSILAVFVIMTRQNMLLVPILLVAYIFWQFGRKAGLSSLAVVVLTFLFFYLYYGPKLLELWLDWLPNLQTPFDKVVTTTSSSNTAFEIPRMVSRIQSFVANIHDHFFVFVGSVSAIILWHPARKWSDPVRYKTTVFMGITYFSLFIMHVWASIFNDYCVWCLQAYQVFYNPTGLLFVILFFSSYNDGSKLRQYLLTLFFIPVSGALGLYYYGWGDWLLKRVFLPLPSRLLNNGEFYTVSLRDVFTYQFAVPMDLQNRVASFLGGLVVGAFFIALIWGFWKTFSLEKRLIGHSIVIVLLACFLFVGTIVPVLLSSPIIKVQCGVEFLSNYETTGRRLADQIPSDILLYWRGSGRHLALMLYMTDVQIFPPQIHAGGGSYRTEDNDIDQLLKVGRFNSKIDPLWREEADYHILWSEYLTRDTRDFFDEPSYEAIPFDMEELSQCEDQLFVFKKR